MALLGQHSHVLLTFTIAEIFLGHYIENHDFFIGSKRENRSKTNERDESFSDSGSSQQYAMGSNGDGNKYIHVISTYIFRNRRNSISLLTNIMH